MGREVKRVALDFKWPIDKVWKGYVNPHYKQCDACEGGGSNLAMAYLESIVRLLMIAGDDAARGKSHPYFESISRICSMPQEPAGKDLLDLTTGLADRGPSFLGHDSCDTWSATKKIIKAAGQPEDWGTCTECGGEGIDPKSKEAYDAWKETEPPVGDGYQIWETVSEGSPISPVFKDPKDLARWMVDNDDSITKDMQYEDWLRFIEREETAPSLIGSSNGKITSGAKAVSEITERENDGGER